jgi:hypothetical protein
MMLRLGDPLPEEIQVLPSPDQLSGKPVDAVW